jgi:hypothetical protein
MVITINSCIAVINFNTLCISQGCLFNFSVESVAVFNYYWKSVAVFDFCGKSVVEHSRSYFREVVGLIKSFAFFCG